MASSLAPGALSAAKCAAPTLAGLLADLELRNARLLAHSRRVATRIQELTQMANSLSDQVARTDADVAALENEAAQTHSLIQGLREAANAIQAQLDANAAQNAALADQLASINARIEDATTDLDADTPGQA